MTFTGLDYLLLQLDLLTGSVAVFVGFFFLRDNDGSGAVINTLITIIGHWHNCILIFKTSSQKIFPPQYKPSSVAVALS